MDLINLSNNNNHLSIYNTFLIFPAIISDC